MAIKYVCDRCGAEVPSPDRFWICEVHYASRQEQGSRFELCDKCADDALAWMSHQQGRKEGYGGD